MESERNCNVIKTSYEVRMLRKSDFDLLKNISIYVFIFLMSGFIFLSSCASVEKRINDYSYTGMWYYENDQRYQVYRTIRDNYYIIVPDKTNTKLIRKYIKKP